MNRNLHFSSHGRTYQKSFTYTIYYNVHVFSMMCILGESYIV